MKYRKGNFITVPNVKWMRTLSTSTQTVYLWLNKYADEEGECFPSYETLATDAHISRRQAIYSIAELKRVGLIKSLRRTIKGEQTSNLYVIIEKETDPKVEKIGGAGGALVQEVHHRGAGDALLGVQVVHPKYNHINETQVNDNHPTGGSNDQPTEDFFSPQKDSREGKGKISELFSAFWMTYPRRVSKPPALKAWKFVFKDLTPDEVDALAAKIVLAVEKFKRSEDWKKDGGTFIPYPATFLNQRRWEDEVRVKIDLNEKAKEDMMKNPGGSSVITNIKKL